MKSLDKLFISIVGCELVGFAGTPFTASAIPVWYATLNKPSFSPPNWLFGPVWTLLYLMMGVAFYLIWRQKSQTKEVRIAKRFFLVQLFLNLIWTPIFFGLRSPFQGFFVIIGLWAVILMTIIKFHPISKKAAYLLIPYLLWVTFASVLNGAILVLN